jgi:hypothetical protein
MFKKKPELWEEIKSRETAKGEKIDFVVNVVQDLVKSDGHI